MANACEGGCYWVGPELCSSCALPAAEQVAAMGPAEAELFARYTAALERHGAKLARVTYRVLDLATLVGVVQVGLRHPHIAARSAATGRLFVQQALEILGPVDPAFAEVIAAGAGEVATPPARRLTDDERKRAQGQLLEPLYHALAACVVVAGMAEEPLPGETAADLRDVAEEIAALQQGAEPLSHEYLAGLSSTLARALLRGESTGPQLLEKLRTARTELQKLQRLIQQAIA